MKENNPNWEEELIDLYELCLESFECTKCGYAKQKDVLFCSACEEKNA